MTSNTEQQPHRLNRRGFLLGLGAGVGAAVTLASGPRTEVEAAVAQDTMKGASAGYRETEHVRRAYDAARF